MAADVVGCARKRGQQLVAYIQFPIVEGMFCGEILWQ